MPAALTTRPNDFAATLRQAVEESGLCLESIQQRLAERGVHVSVATLSYWQSGNRVPGRKRSEMVVAHLESVLGLEPRSLRVLVPAPRPRGPVRTPDKFVLAPHFNEREAVRAIAERVQATQSGHQLTRISQHDVVRIDEGRRMTSVRIRTVARADADGITGMGVTQFFEDATAGSPRLTVNSGAAIRTQHVDPAHRVIGTELEFAQVLTRGDTVVLDYEISSDGPGPRDYSYDTSCARAIRECVVEVHFRPDDLPAWVESYHRPQEGQEVRRRVPVDALGHAHVVVLDAAPGTTGLEWHF